jgi:hypothetical protein
MYIRCMIHMSTQTTKHRFNIYHILYI